MNRIFLRFLLCALVLFLAVGALIYSSDSLSPSVDLSQQGDLLSLLEAKIRDEGLTLTHFFEPYVSEVVVFPRLIMMAAYQYLGTWNSQIQSYLVFAVGILNFLLLCLLLIETKILDFTSWLSIPVVITFAFVFFMVQRWHIWFWNNQLQDHLSIFGVLITLIALVKAGESLRYKRYLIVATIGATIASLSIGYSLALWLACILFFIYVRSIRIYFFPWFCCFGMVFSLYFWNIPTDSILQDINSFDATVFSKYLTVFLFSNNVAYTLLFVVVLALLLPIMLNRRNKAYTMLENYLPWATLNLYCLGYMATVSLNSKRLIFGNEFYSDHMTVSMLFFISLSSIAMRAFREIGQHLSKSMIRIASISFLLVVLGIGVTYSYRMLSANAFVVGILVSESNLKLNDAEFYSEKSFSKLSVANLYDVLKQDSRFNIRFVSERDFYQQSKQLQEIDVVFASYQLSLSDETVAGIKRYGDNGGVLVQDMRFADYDTDGRLRGGWLDEIFGIGGFGWRTEGEFMGQDLDQDIDQDLDSYINLRSGSEGPFAIFAPAKGYETLLTAEDGTGIFLLGNNSLVMGTTLSVVKENQLLIDLMLDSLYILATK